MSETVRAWRTGGFPNGVSYALGFVGGVPTVTYYDEDAAVSGTIGSDGRRMSDLLREFSIAAHEANSYRKVVELIAPLQDEKEIIDAAGLKIGSNLHDAIPKLIELARECLRLRKATPYPTYDSLSNSIMYKGARISLEFMEQFFGEGEEWRGPLWTRRSGDSVEVTTSQPLRELNFVPCPWCKSEARLTSNGDGGAVVVCRGCGARGPSHRFAYDAMDAWNALPR